MTSRTRTLTVGALALIVVVIAMAFALGGNGSMPATSTSSPSVAVGSAGGTAQVPDAVPRPVANAPHYADSAVSAAGNKSVTAASGGANAPAQANHAVAASGGVAATRVVKTGSLSMTVHKGLVASTITKLTTATTRLGGYVAQSQTDNVNGAPTGSLTLRIPVANFETAITTATNLGHETSLNTNAHDVTGKYVDLKARSSALKRTRSTYLTILSRAHTIGQTLSVQQRVNDIQEQIESLQGELKVLRNQSSDGTLTVSVSETGSPVATPTHHHRGGFSAAFHRSTSRFNRGLQSIIGGLGPLLLAAIVLGVIVAIGRIGVRRINRATT